MYRDEFYMQSEQQKSVEDVVVYLIENKQRKLVTPVLDLMRMSENWYGRLEELRDTKIAPSSTKDSNVPDNKQT